MQPPVESIPSAGSVLREADRARTPESKVRVWSRSLDPIDSIGQLLSITVGRIVPAEGIPLLCCGAASQVGGKL